MTHEAQAMSAPRTIGLAALSIVLFLAALSRCASGGPQSDPEASPPVAVTGPAVPATPSEAPAAPPAVPAGPTAAAPGPAARVDFASQILPLLQEKCSPCHFPGGRMYSRLPFDQEGTIRVLGTQLFSRLREPLDQELIRQYLEQP